MKNDIVYTYRALRREKSKINQQSKYYTVMDQIWNLEVHQTELNVKRKQ